MPENTPPEMKKLCVHTITTKPWPIEEAVERYARAGVAGITVWRQALEGREPKAAGRRIREAGLEIVSLCRGGFFPRSSAARRREAIEENKRVIDEAAALGAPLVVLVCGSLPGQPLAESRKQIAEGIAAVMEHARASGVRLAVEPLHPMYAAERSAINTLKQANEICEALASPAVGVALDVYHVWWEPGLASEIERCGRAGRLFAFHVCDWKIPTEDLLNDRGLMGEGGIPIRAIRGWVEAAGFDGFNEVEIFSTKRWAQDQGAYLEQIVAAYRQHA